MGKTTTNPNGAIRRSPRAASWSYTMDDCPVASTGNMGQSACNRERYSFRVSG